MANGILLGIDLGTTALKACAIEEGTGEARAEAERRLDVRSLPGGGRVQDLAALDRSLEEAVGLLRARLGAEWRRVRGVGIAAQGGSSIIADRSTGEPRTPMILWNDARSRAHAARLTERAPPELWRAQLLGDVPPHGLGRLAWLKERHPDIFDSGHIHAGAGEYVFFRLTGAWRQDPGNAVQVGSYNAARKELDRTLLDLVGVPLSFVAPLRTGHESLPLSSRGAAALGLPEGTPVAGPYIDQEAGYLSAACVTPRPLQCSLGTAWVGNFVLPDDTTGFSPFQLVLPSPLGGGRLVVQPLLTGNAAWDWGLDHLIGAPRPQVYSRAAEVFGESLIPPEGLVALPWFAQANPLVPSAAGGGAFLGVSPATCREDLLRALAAGMAFELARMLESVKRSGDVDGVVLTGGASRAPVFRRLLAALFSPLPVRCQDERVSAAARGALFALDAGAARLKSEPVPAPRGDEIRARYETYLAAFERLYGSVRAGAAFEFEGSAR